MSSFSANPKKTKLTPVQVFLRIRPKHAGDGAPAIANCTPKEIHMKGHSKGYSFDQIFDDKTNQSKVYKTVVGKMITDVTKGYNCTIFAYGQTGTGKTYTVMGEHCMPENYQTWNWQEESDAGIILRAAVQLYEDLNKLDPSIQKTVTVSFMEIYNEEIRDLLCDKELTPLRIYEDRMKSVKVKNLQEIIVLNPLDIIQLLKKGCEKRQVASTLMNNRSSRSHTVFTISVSTMQTISVSENISNIICGKLNLIDLAGSENIAKSGSKEQRARETTNINQSLLTLGRVIKALVENSSHVPYRESKLTRILKDSLGGSAKTAIIATISPGMASLDETMSTLDYAHNARNITNCPTINLRTSETAAAVQEELQRLKRDLFATANEQGVYMDKQNYDEMTKSLTQYKKEIDNKHETIRNLMERVEEFEAQRDEWENLKESFNKTSQAYQMIQSEVQKKEEEMQRGTELIEKYKEESSMLQEFVEQMLTRESYLQKKLNHVYASSSKNKDVTESIIEILKKTIVNLRLDDSPSFSNKISLLIQFNEKVCNMIDNVKIQLEEKSSPLRNTVENNSIEDYTNKIKTCNDKFEDFDKSIKSASNYLSQIKESQKEQQESNSQIGELLGSDAENYEKFKQDSNQIISKQKSSILSYFEERQKSIQIEQMQMQAIKEMIENDSLEKKIAEYSAKREKIYEEISNLDQSHRKAIQKVNDITTSALQSIDSLSKVEDIRNSFLYIAEEMKVLEHIRTDYRRQNSEMANVLDQISHILKIEGKAHVEMVNEPSCATGQELVEKIKAHYESSAVPINRTGDTPKPLEGIQSLPRTGRNSLVRNLFQKKFPEDSAGSQ